MSGIHIKRVTIHGFKSYSDTVTFGPFTAGVNGIVGLNGSGKSNFYNAIEFVLLDEFDHLRPSVKKSLLHEGQGVSSPTAFVEIVFSNENRVIPIEKDEISIRRSISLQKDEYFIDRKHSTRQDVRNILEQCGFSPASGYYIIKQSKVTSLTTMTDAQRLDLLLDIAGVKVYDAQRDESVKMIAQSNERKKKIEDSLEYINNRLQKLDEEKAELEEFNELDKKRRAIEILIQERSTRENQNEIDARNEELQIQNEALVSHREEYDQLQEKISKVTDNLTNNRIKEKLCMQQRVSLQQQETDAIKQHERAQLKASKYEQKLKTAEAEIQEKKQKLSRVEDEIAEANKQEEAYSAQFNEVSKKKAEIEGELTVLQNLCAGQLDDIDNVTNELKLAKKEIDKFSKEIKNTEKGVQKAQKELDAATDAKRKLIDEIKSLKEEQKEINEKRNDCLDERKLAWSKRNTQEKEVHDKKKLIQELRSKATRTANADVANGIDYIKKNNFKGFMGVVIDLIEVDQEATIAATVIGGRRLYYVVVDTVDNAKVLTEKVQSQKFACSTIILEKINSNHKAMPDGVDALLNHIKYEEEFEPVMKYIFGNYALTKTLTEANTISESKRVNCVTIQGETIDSSGLMRGGTNHAGKSPLVLAWQLNASEKELKTMQDELKETVDKLNEIEENIKKCDNDMSAVQKKLSDCKNREGEARANVDKARINLDKAQKNYEASENQLSDMQLHANSVEQRLASLQEPKGEADEKTRARVRELLDLRIETDSERTNIIQLRSILRKRLRDELITQQRNLTDQIADLDPSRIQQKRDLAVSKAKEAEKKLSAVNAKQERNNEKLTEATNEINKLSAEVDSLKNDQSKVDKKIKQYTSSMDRIHQRLSLLEQRQEEIKNESKAIGTYPEDEIKEFEDLSMSQLYNSLHEVNESLVTFRFVNKKAIEQYQSFSSQREELERRREELASSGSSITSLIASLDNKKNEAIEHTFAQISDNFAKIFTELVPTGQGVLSLLKNPEDDNKAVGIGIRVRFGDGTEEVGSAASSMMQLSGGQQSLVALALVFAIQKFSPAPFYLMDESDAALDPVHRKAVADVIKRISRPEEGAPAQFILTSFKPELLEECEKMFAIVTEKNHSVVKEVQLEDALTIVNERENA